MKYEPKKITLDLQEWIDVQKELNSLKKPADGEELTEAEHQHAVGILLKRALDNPNLFRSGSTDEIDIGLCKALLLTEYITTPSGSGSVLKVKFIRT
jgi:hypothetical protein